MLIALLFIALIYFVFAVVIPGTIAGMLFWFLALFGITRFGVRKLKIAGDAGKVVLTEGVPEFNRAMMRGVLHVHNRVKNGESAPRWAIWLVASPVIVIVVFGLISVGVALTREASANTETHLAAGAASSSASMTETHADTGIALDSSGSWAGVYSVAAKPKSVASEITPEIKGRIRYKDGLIEAEAALNMVGMTYSLEGAGSTVLVTTFDSSVDESIVEGYLDGASRKGFPLDDAVLRRAGFTSTRATSAFGGVWERNVGGTTVRTVR